MNMFYLLFDLLLYQIYREQQIRTISQGVFQIKNMSVQMIIESQSMVILYYPVDAVDFF